MNYSVETTDSFDLSRRLFSYVKNNKYIINMHYAALPNNPLIDLNIANNISSDNIKLLNDYTDIRGSMELRSLICERYKNNYGLAINPEHEIILTNGSVEAFVLAVLVTSLPSETIAVTNPTYPLFAKAIASLGRKVYEIERVAGNDEYKDICNDALVDVKALVINSPENPTGYVLSKSDWCCIESKVQEQNLYIIHDEILGELDFCEQHTPSIAIPSLKHRSLVLGGMSKSFGLPGLKIGWLIAPHLLINKAFELHRDLYLSINPLSQKLAIDVFSHPGITSWLCNTRNSLKKRSSQVMSSLTAKNGYAWPRVGCAGLSLTPNISGLYEKIAWKYKTNDLSKGSVVAKYLLEEKRVSTVPGVIYGSGLADHIKIAICGAEFSQGLTRLVCAM